MIQMTLRGFHDDIIIFIYCKKNYGRDFSRNSVNLLIEKNVCLFH